MTAKREGREGMGKLIRILKKDWFWAIVIAVLIAMYGLKINIQFGNSTFNLNMDKVIQHTPTKPKGEK